MGPRPLGLCPRLVCLVVLLLIAATAFSDGKPCKLNACSSEYSHQLETNGLVQGPNYAYCKVLKSHIECLRAAARFCRGDLKFHIFKSAADSWNNDFRCAEVLSQDPNTSTTPPSTAQANTVAPTATTQCVFRPNSKNYSYCGLFGDPHLRTFSGKFQTCTLSGAWPFIDNPHLAVQVTNNPVTDGGKATVVSKVTAIVRENGPCADEKTYEAQTDDLPPTFIDGTTYGGTDRSVSIEKSFSSFNNVANGSSLLVIYIRHIDTRILIRQLAKYLSVVVRMPEEIASQNGGNRMQLCSTGCPDREKFDMEAYVKTVKSPHSVQLQWAITLCKNKTLEGRYLDACVFDIMTTGDDSFSRVAGDAMKDLNYTQVYSLQSPELETRFSTDSSFSDKPCSCLGLILCVATLLLTWT